MTHLSVEYDPAFSTEPDDIIRAVFFMGKNRPLKATEACGALAQNPGVILDSDD